MKIKKGDTVKILTGKDRGKSGKIFKVLPRAERVMVEGINLVKKHRKPRRTGEKGQVVEVPKSIDVSNMLLICPKCGKAVRLGFKIIGEKKYRICRKCGEEI